jgi:hypothetical protein
MDVINAILSENYFQFSNDYYKQGGGLPMGDPSFEILAKIFLQFLQHNDMYYILKNCKIVGYVRYVDGILIQPNLQFTVVKEQNNKIQFIDITIQ